MITRTQILYNSEWLTLDAAKVKAENDLGKLIDSVIGLNAKQRLALLDMLEKNSTSVIKLLDDLNHINQIIKQD